MTSRIDVLRQVMLQTGTTQVDLSRTSGVHQPKISQILSGKTSVSDGQIDRLLSCMGYRLEVVRQPVVPELTRSERRSWRLHREVSSHLKNSTTFDQWRPTLDRNLDRLRSGVTGEPHLSNLGEWEHLIETRDRSAIHRRLTGLDRHSIEMREVSPFGGILSDEDRLRVLREAS